MLRCRWGTQMVSCHDTYPCQKHCALSCFNMTRASRKRALGVSTAGNQQSSASSRLCDHEQVTPPLCSQFPHLYKSKQHTATQHAMLRVAERLGLPEGYWWVRRRWWGGNLPPQSSRVPPLFVLEVLLGTPRCLRNTV